MSDDVLAYCRAAAYARPDETGYDWEALLADLAAHGPREPVRLNPDGYPGSGWHRAVGCHALDLELAIDGTADQITRVRQWLTGVVLPPRPY